jgi:hypothetical protein
MQPVVELWGELPSAIDTVWEPAHYMTGATRHLENGQGAGYAASYAARGLACLRGEEDSPEWVTARDAEQEIQCSLLRDIVGSPFRPFSFDSTWLANEGAPVVALARRIEAEGRFDDVGILSGALERVGYRDRAVLEHCRRPGPHVRGCWVLDALLGRESAVR